MSEGVKMALMPSRSGKVLMKWSSLEACVCVCVSRTFVSIVEGTEILGSEVFDMMKDSRARCSLYTFPIF